MHPSLTSHTNSGTNEMDIVAIWNSSHDHDGNHGKDGQNKENYVEYVSGTTLVHLHSSPKRGQGHHYGDEGKPNSKECVFRHLLAESGNGRKKTPTKMAIRRGDAVASSESDENDAKDRGEKHYRKPEARLGPPKQTSRRKTHEKPPLKPKQKIKKKKKMENVKENFRWGVGEEKWK